MLFSSIESRKNFFIYLKNIYFFTVYTSIYDVSVSSVHSNFIHTSACADTVFLLCRPSAGKVT